MRNTILSSVSQRLWRAMVVTVMVLAALPVKPAFAATITVNTTTDEYTSTGSLCSLREAIALANSNLVSQNDCTRTGIGDDDIITLESGKTYTLTLAGSGGTPVGDLDIGDASGLSGSLTIQAGGSTPAIIDANDIDRVLDVDPAGNTNLTLIGITVTNGNTTGQATTSGGGISFSGTGILTLTNSTISSNVSASGAGCGGGIFNNSAATVVITNSTIDGNSCPNPGSDGAGIFKGTGGSLTITGSTISNNSAAENGGGIHISAGTTTITNSTIAGNTAGNRGGGLQVGGSTAVVSVDFTTISSNIANEDNIIGGGLNGGGALQISLGSITITRSILANSLVTLGQIGTPKDCDKAATPITSITDSIVENNNDCTGSFSAGDPMLVALADNGGPTRTMAIPIASPAYNTADSCGLATTDQRGYTRPQVGFCDLGAYEIQNAASPTVVSVVRADATPSNAASVNYTVTFSESVSGVDATDFDPIPSPGITGETVGVVSGSGTTWTVPVNTGTGDGTIKLDVLDNNSIVDSETNPLDGGFTTGEVYTIDKTAPTAMAISRANNAVMGTPTVEFAVSFSEPVTGVGSTDFQLVPGGGVTGASIGTTSGLGTAWTVTVNTGTGDGTINLELKSSGTGIKDAALNNISGGFTTGETYTIVKSASVVDVNIAGTTVANGNDLSIPLKTGQRYGFAGVDNGPAQIVSVNGIPIISALRVIWKEYNNTRTSYSEMMGLPKEGLSSEYWFPWYNNLSVNSMDQGFRIANVDVADTTIKVMRGATQLDSFTLLAGASVRKNYNVDDGPIRIYSVENRKIIAALRVIWKEPGYRSSYSEMMGLPKEQLSNEYWFPWYNNLSVASMDQGFRIANVDPASGNTVEVWIGNTKQTPDINLAGGQSVRVNYNADNGPVKVICTTCSNTGSDKIIAALRVIWQENNNTRTSYSEMMGLPKEQLTNEYWFPWYNNLSITSMDQGFRIANVDNASNTVEVWVGNTKQTPDVVLAAKSGTRVGYPADSGPVRIVCTTCTNTGTDKIIAALRVIWKEPGYRSSYSEMMGLPKELLSTEYWFPWYNFAAPNSMDQGFRISTP